MSTLLMSLVACFCCSFAHADSPPTLHFDIPAGEAQKTLLQFVTQSNIEMLYSSDDVHGITTHAVSGDLTVAQALRTMTAGTGLEISFENDFTFASIKTTAKFDTGPETPADLLAAVAARDVPRGLRDVVPAQAFASEQKLEEVVVTGTLMHGVVDIVSPLQFVTRGDMTRASYATVQDALRALTLSFKAGQSEDTGVAGNFGRGVAANLRGLGAGATLVLIDGHRQPLSGSFGDFVDLSNIPWSAVERIEVLPDGASALYGSDAIAGVVNIIMRKDFRGGETWARLGGAADGADEKLVAQLFGHSWASGHALFSYQYSERSSLAAADRDYAATDDKTPFGGTDLRSFRSSPGNILDPRTLQPTYAIPASGALTLSDLLPGQVNLQNRYSTYELLPDRRTHSAFFNVSQDIGERSELSVEGRFGRRDIEQQVFAFEQTLLVPGTNPYAASLNPYARTPFVLVGYSFLDTLGPLYSEADTKTYSGSIGLKTKLAETWRLTLSGSYGREQMYSATYNLPNQTALSAALSATTRETAFNPFGSNSRALIDSLRMTQIDRSDSTIKAATVVADGTLTRLASGDARLALGSELRQEGFGNAINSPFARQVRSAFAELSVPIVGDAEDPRATPRLELSLAGRYERYSDFGSTWNPKLGARWAPSEWFKVRTSWGTSFKAPRLTDLHDSSHDSVSLVPLKDPRSATGSSIVLALQGRNPELTEETAKTWTAGIDFAFQRWPGSALSLTYYSIDYTNRIVLPAALAPTEILLQENQWASAIDRDVSRAQIEAACASPSLRGATVAQCLNSPVAAIVDFTWRNLAATKVKGIDLKFDREVQTSSLGVFKLDLSSSYMLSFDQAVSDTSPVVNLVNTVGNPLALRFRSTLEWYEHRWDLPGFGASMTLDHTGGYRDVGLATTRDVAGATTLDVQVSYKTPKTDRVLGDLDFILNATNVFDKAPPFVNREDGYDTRNTDPYGRVVSFSISKKW